MAHFIAIIIELYVKTVEHVSWTAIANHRHAIKIKFGCYNYSHNSCYLITALHVFGQANILQSLSQNVV